MKIIKYDVKLPVTVRKHDVNIPGLQALLREHKQKAGLSNKKIADRLGRPMTEVEHWFRTDKCFSIPQPGIWYGLKSLVNIETTEYDAQVMDFVVVDGQYDQANRIYDTEGLSPTVTATGDIIIIESEGIIATYREQPRGEILMNGLTLNDFFCGAGGMGLGFQQAGFEIVGAWDFDKYAVESYRENVGDHVRQADISKMTWEDVPKADVWAFGFPCQDLSVAGKQAGMIKGQTRSGLFYEVMRLLEETRNHKPENLPSIIVAENVKALKKVLPTLKEEYEAQGYEMTETLYNSKYWGVPQNRERYFVAGLRKDLNLEFEFLEQQTENVPKLSSILETNVDEKYYIDDEKAAKIIEQAVQKLEKLGTAVQHGVIVDPEQDLHGVIIDASQAKREGVHRVYPEASPTLNARDYKEPRLVCEATEEPQLEMVGMLDVPWNNDHLKRVYDPAGLSPTLVARNGGHTQIKIIEGIAKYRVRKLTPREYARLQGFPESYRIVVSNSQAYKQFGNAVTTNVAKAVATAIKNALTK